MRMIALLLVALLFFGCGQKSISYREQVQPILTDKCVSCHDEATHKGKVVLTSYDALANSRTKSGKEPVAIPGNANGSRLFTLVATDQRQYRMPPDSAHSGILTKEEREVIWRWIQQGAKNN